MVYSLTVKHCYKYIHFLRRKPKSREGRCLTVETFSAFSIFMSVRIKFTVERVEPIECRDWVLNKHYAHRIPSISYAFGLFRGAHLEGILTIGKPASPAPCVGVCGEEYANFVYELNRLCVNEDLGKNVLSFFVGQVLKQLPKMILISYADTAQGHHGYIYQATNWLYTGLTAKRTDPISNLHGRHGFAEAKSRGALSEREARPQKHRYIYFTKSARRLRAFLRWESVPYPKGENQRYDASYSPITQSKLFG